MNITMTKKARQKRKVKPVELKSTKNYLCLINTQCG